MAGGRPRRRRCRRPRRSTGHARSSSSTGRSTTTGRCRRERRTRARATRTARSGRSRRRPGLRCELEGELASVSYHDAAGRPKIVRYWLMRPVGDDAAPDHGDRRRALATARRGRAACSRTSATGRSCARSAPDALPASCRRPERPAGGRAARARDPRADRRGRPRAGRRAAAGPRAGSRLRPAAHGRARGRRRSGAAISSAGSCAEQPQRLAQLLRGRASGRPASGARARCRRRRSPSPGSGGVSVRERGARLDGEARRLVLGRRVAQRERGR